ncbi:MAG: Smr/MutS family protein [Burkholderiales bacterium]
MYMAQVDDKSDIDTPHPDEAGLFRAAVEDVVPVRYPKRASLSPAPPRPIALQRQLDDQQVLVDSLSDPTDVLLETGEELQFLRNGLSRDVLRKLRRGKWVIQAQLDMHGMVSAEARVSLVDFLHEAAKAGARCVRIIHGKGLSSFNREPVLKHKVKHWLSQRDEVLAFAEARPADGGSGAVVVLLKSPRR